MWSEQGGVKCAEKYVYDGLLRLLQIGLLMFEACMIPTESRLPLTCKNVAKKSAEILLLTAA